MPTRSTQTHPTSANDLRMVVTAVGLGFSSNAVLMAAVPKLAEGEYGLGSGGLIAGTFMAFTVASQLVVPRMLRRMRPVLVLRLAIVVVGVTPVLYVVSNLAVALVATAGRGVGFGLLTVIGPLLTMNSAAPGTHNRALGLYGVATSIGSIVAVPLGVALIDRNGLHTALAVSAALALCSLSLAGLGLGSSGSLAAPEDVTPASLSLLRRELPILTCFFLACGANANATTFIAVYVPAFGPAALLAGGLCRSASRYLVGLLVGPLHLRTALAATALIGTVGYSLIPLVGANAAVVAAAALAGVGAGGVATLALVATMEASREHEWASSSTVWNVAFNSGMAVGSFGFTGFLAFVDYRGAFVANAGLAALATAIALVLVRTR